MAAESTLQIYYDGRCSLCRTACAWVGRRDRSGSLELRDFNAEADEALPGLRAALDRQLWVRDPAGATETGFAAVCRVLERLPRWRWLARLMAMPPLRWLGTPLYRWLACNRRVLRI